MSESIDDDRLIFVLDTEGSLWKMVEHLFLGQVLFGTLCEVREGTEAKDDDDVGDPVIDLNALTA